MAKHGIWSNTNKNEKFSLLVVFAAVIVLPITIFFARSSSFRFSGAASLPTPTPNQQAPNLATNGSFEQQGSRATTADEWVGSGLVGADRRTDEDSVFGNYSFKFQGQKNKAKSLEHSTPVTAQGGDRFDLTAYVRADKLLTSGLVAVQLDFRLQGQLLESFEMKVDTTQNISSWLQRADAYILRFPADSVDVRLVVENQRGDIFFDGISLRQSKLSFPTPTSSPFPFPTQTPGSPTPPPPSTPTPTASPEPNRLSCGISIDPTIGFAPLTVRVFVEPEFAVSSDTDLGMLVDWEGDGVWDFKGAYNQALEHIYREPNDYRPTAQLIVAGGLTNTCSTSLVVN